MSSNNKDKCKALRIIREKLMKELNINEIDLSPCTYQGECKGTCPRCEYEEKMLLESIYNLKKEKHLKDILIKKDKELINDSNILGLLERRDFRVDKLEGDVEYNEKSSKYNEYLSKTDFSKNNEK